MLLRVNLLWEMLRNLKKRDVIKLCVVQFNTIKFIFDLKNKICACCKCGFDFKNSKQI